MSRTRSRPLKYQHKGYQKLWAKNNPIQPPPLSEWLDSGSRSYVPETCVDDLSPGPPYTKQNPFDLKKTTQVHYSASGKADRGYSWWYLRNAEMYSVEPHSLGGWLSPDLLYWETKALARAAPDKPVVDVGVFGFELKDIPRMIQDAGNIKLGRQTVVSGAKDLSAGWLSANFGWIPLISDLHSLVRFASSWSERAKFLNRNRNRRVRVRLARESSKANLAGDVTIPGYNQLRYYSNLYKRTDTTEVWASYTLKWEGEDLPEEPFGDVRTALGLNGQVNPVTLWNMTPWSWLIDYLTNVGDVLTARRGVIPFDLVGISVMAHSVRKIEGNSSETFGPLYPDLKFRDAHFVYERKQRRVSPVARPHVRFTPILTSGQAANLGALATSLLLRGR